MADREPSEYALGHLGTFVDHYNALQTQAGGLLHWDDLPFEVRKSLSGAFTYTVDKIQEELY